MKKSMKLLAMALAGAFVLSGCADNADKQTASTGTAASTTAALQTAAETTAKIIDEKNPQGYIHSLGSFFVGQISCPLARKEVKTPYFLRVKRHTVSICVVNGNISTGCNFLSGILMFL